MNAVKTKRWLLIGAVLVLPAAVIGIQSWRIAKYEADLAQASLSEAEDDAARFIRENMIDLLEQFRQAVIETLPADFDPDRDSYYFRPNENRWGSDVTVGVFSETSRGLRELDVPAVLAFRSLARAEGVPDSDMSEIIAEMAASPREDTFVRWHITLDDYRDRLLVDYEAFESFDPFAPPEIVDPEIVDIREEFRAITANALERLDITRDLNAIARTYPVMRLTDGNWQAFEGVGVWLLTRVSVEGSPPLLIAVDGQALARQIVDIQFPRTRIGLAAEAGLDLGAGLDSLRVLVSSDLRDGLSAAESPGPSFYEVTIVLAIGFAMMGAFFLWRDTRREAALAEMRSQFVSSVSHELKTPLTSIRMFAESLQLAEELKSDNAGSRSDYLEIIVRESERLTRLLNNVLAFSQIERGLRTYYLQAENLGEILHDVAQMLQFPLAEQGLQLDLSIVDEVPSIRVDRDAIEQAVLNLLSNAIKFSGDGRQIELTLELDDSDAVISVIDHGIGIPDLERSRIFDSFYRVSSNKDLAISGTGLGLAIVKHIADGHGGRVTVDSEPGKGSTFSLRIPIDRRSGG